MNDRYSAIFDPTYWGKHGPPHALLTELRRKSPVFWLDTGRYDPVWLLTRHADVEYVSKHPRLFLSAPRTVIFNSKSSPRRLRGLPQMDPPEHTQHRRSMQSWFTPRAVRALEERISRIAKELIDELAKTDSADFCSTVGVQLPLKVICGILGLPDEEEPRIWNLTQSVFNTMDPDRSNDADIYEGVRKTMEFCAEVAKERRASPTDDFASTIANAEIDGEKTSIQQSASHIMVMITAGHDTTASAINGGLLALIRHPDQLAKLQRDPVLIESAVDEILRYVSPTPTFVRTASEDTEIRGVKIARGEDVCLHYTAANRDEEVFDRPDDFIVDRTPNRHLAFGVGAHACLGQVLAKIEMRALFRELIGRIDFIELAGEPQNVRSFFVSGLKHLPIRYRLTSESRYVG